MGVFVSRDRFFTSSNVVTRRGGSNTSTPRECAAAGGRGLARTASCGFVGNAVMITGTPHVTRCTPCRLAVLVVALGLGACNPVETWRDWTGVSQNDPDPDTTPNTKNLAAGEAADYPNLATVPAPPIRAMTAAEREKLTQSLIADRTNARYSDEQLRAGFSASSTVPPPPAADAAAKPGNTQPELAGTPRPSPQPAALPTQPAGKFPGNYAAAASPRSSTPVVSSTSATPAVNSYG